MLRGDVENRIKELKLELKADRLSCHRFLANQFRLLLHTAAYCLFWLLRHHLQGTDLATAQVNTLRLKLLKIEARIRETSRRIWVQLASGYPYSRPAGWAVAKPTGQPRLISPSQPFRLSPWDSGLRWIRFFWTRDWEIISGPGGPEDGKRAGS